VVVRGKRLTQLCKSATHDPLLIIYERDTELLKRIKLHAVEIGQPAYMVAMLAISKKTGCKMTYEECFKSVRQYAIKNGAAINATARIIVEEYLNAN
jgi:hypothetical protein